MNYPPILSERCFKRSVLVTTVQRQSLQNAYIEQVFQWFNSILSSVTPLGWVNRYGNGVSLKVGEWRLNFTYQETDSKVIKRLSTYRAHGYKRSTLPAFLKWLKDNTHVS